MPEIPLTCTTYLHRLIVVCNYAKEFHVSPVKNANPIHIIGPILHLVLYSKVRLIRIDTAGYNQEARNRYRIGASRYVGGTLNLITDHQGNESVCTFSKRTKITAYLTGTAQCAIRKATG